MPDTSQRLAFLNASCEVAEYMLLRGFQALASTPKTSWADFDKAVDILTRVTAVRKSLIHESERRSPEPAAPRPSSPDSPNSSPDPESDNHRSPDSPVSPNPAPADSQVSAVSTVSAVHANRSVHVIRDIPAMPLDRIEGALDRVMTDLDRQMSTGQSRSPEPQDPQSDPNVPSLESQPCETRSPERHDRPAVSESAPGDSSPARPAASSNSPPTDPG